MEIDGESSLLLMAGWDGAKRAALNHATPGDPMEVWLRKGDQELRNLPVGIGIDVYTTLRVLNPLFEIPAVTHSMIAYLALAQFEVFAFHRRPALDDSMRSKAAGRHQGQGDTPAVSLLPATQVDSLQVAFSLLVECCLPEEPRHLRTSSIFKSLKQIRGIERWCGASGSLIVVDLACCVGLVQAVPVRAGREIVWADPGSLRFEVNALRYQQGGQNVAPDVKLHSREALELIHPALFADAAKVLEDHRSGAVLVTKVTPEQIAVRGLDYWDTTDLIFV